MDAQQLFLAKKKAKKEARRNKKEEEASLGMTSLMDIVSIIVIYLLKSYASDPVLIQPIAEQKIPMSKADTPIQAGVAVYISSKELIFNEKKLVTLKDGQLDENSVKGHLITDLYDKMVEEAEKAKEMAEARQQVWEGRLILIGDQSLKFKTIVDVMFTAGRAKYTEYAFCVIKSG
jgi:biopolymer transport protein ExbD